MYRVTIQLEHGCKVEFVEPCILRAAARVEEYHENMLFCDIQQMEEGVSIGGGKVDQAGNGVAGQQENQSDTQAARRGYNRAAVGVSDVPCR